MKIAEDQIGPVKCDLIRSCLVNALLSNKLKMNFVVFTLLKSKMLKLFFMAFNFAIFKIYLNSTVIVT